MRVHHINAGTMCPFVGESMVCHCLVVETHDGLALVDSGIGVGDMADLRRRMGWAFANIARPRPDPDDTAVRRLEKLGFAAADVRHILVTHLDLDHAGGIPDFPRATVHCYRPEHDAARARATYNERNRYRPHQLAGARWALHEPDGQGDRWFGFQAVKPLLEDLAIVPLVGHTRGHAAIAVRDDAGWMLHCGDAYFNAGEVNVEKPGCPLPLRLFQRIIAMDDAARRANQDRLRQLVRDHGKDVRVFCAHDRSELERETRANVSAQPRAAATA